MTNSEQTAFAISSLISTTLFTFASGFQDASCTLIGNAIGSIEEGDLRIGKAWRYANMLSSCAIVMTFLSIICLFYYSDLIVAMFANDEEVGKLLKEILPLVFINFFFETI